MNCITCLLVLLVALILAAATAQEVSYLTVVAPASKAGELAHTLAVFGASAAGGSIAGVVVDGTPAAGATACDQIQPTQNWPSAAIVLVNRGPCPLVLQTQRAALAGASAIIVVESLPTCPVGVTNSSTCEAGLPFLAGSLERDAVEVPVVLVSHEDGKGLQDCLAGAAPCSDGTPMVVTLDWSVATRSGKVWWDFWTSSAGSSNVVEEFYRFADYLEGALVFTPRYFVHDGAAWGCTAPAAAATSWCSDHCTNGGRYCLPTVSEKGVGPNPAVVKGAAVLEENLRQLCVWQVATDGSKVPADDAAWGRAWWKYAVDFDVNCGMAEFSNAPCVSNMLTAAGLKEDDVNACMTAAGGLASGANTLFDDALKTRRDHHVDLLPSTRINGVPHSDARTGMDVLEVICSGYEHGTQPLMCDCVSRSQVLGKRWLLSLGDDLSPCRDEEGIPNSVVGGLIAGAILLVCVAAAVCFVYCRTKRQLNLMDTKYQPLSPSSRARLRGAGRGGSATGTHGEGVELSAASPAATTGESSAL